LADAWRSRCSQALLRSCCRARRAPATTPTLQLLARGGLLSGAIAAVAAIPGSATIARVLADQLAKTGVTTPELIEFVGDDESPFIEAGIPVAGAENGQDEKKTRSQANVLGGQAGEPL
jgi:aminopeptidase S